MPNKSRYDKKKPKVINTQKLVKGNKVAVIIAVNTYPDDNRKFSLELKIDGIEFDPVIAKMIINEQENFWESLSEKTANKIQTYIKTRYKKDYDDSAHLTVWWVNRGSIFTIVQDGGGESIFKYNGQKWQTA
jgi:hypothetical protein